MDTDANHISHAAEGHDARLSDELQENDLENAAGGFIDTLLSMYVDFKRGFRDAVNDANCY